MLPLLVCACAVAPGCLLSNGAVRRIAGNTVGGGAEGASDNQAALRQALRDVLFKEDLLSVMAGELTRGVMHSLTEEEQQRRVQALVRALTETLTREGDEGVRRIVKNAGGELDVVLTRALSRALRQADAGLRDIIRGDLNEATDHLVQRMTAALSAAVARELEGPLGRSLEDTSGRLARGLVDETTRALTRPDNQEAARAFVRIAMRDAVRGAADGLRDELRRSPAQAALTAAVVVLGVALVGLGIGAWLLGRQYLHSAKALSLVAQKINDGPMDRAALKQAIFQAAQRNKVDGWLSDFLKRRGL